MRTGFAVDIVGRRSGDVAGHPVGPDVHPNGRTEERAGQESTGPTRPPHLSRDWASAPAARRERRQGLQRCRWKRKRERQSRGAEEKVVPFPALEQQKGQRRDPAGKKTKSDGMLILSARTFTSGSPSLSSSDTDGETKRKNEQLRDFQFFSFLFSFWPVASIAESAVGPSAPARTSFHVFGKRHSVGDQCGGLCY